MAFSRHITRNFNANKTHRIRYDEDDFTCQIFRYDKTFEKHYTPSNVPLSNVVNGEKKSWYGMGAYCSKNEKQMTITIKYNAKETSNNYRLELLFGNTHKQTPTGKVQASLKASATIRINGETVKNSMSFIGTDVNFSRNYQYCTLKQGENTIEYVLSSNTIFIGLAIKKYDIWEAKRHNNRNDKLTMIKASVEHTQDFSINTMTCEFMYYHELDELLEPTNANANRSGLIFDYRDEINLYVKDTNGANQQVFGGYISTVEVDDDLTKVTMECADRLIDLDRRYCLSEITINNYQGDENADYSNYADLKKNYNNYSDPLKFLLNNNEIYLNSNLKIGDSLVDRTSRKLANYRKGGYTKLTKSNMNTQVNKGSITVRNGADTLKKQSLVIYDDNVNNHTVLLNTYPNLYFHYGLGVEKWEEKVEETKTVTVQGSTQAKSTWVKRANSITSATGNSAIKPIWQYCYSKIKYVYKKDFYQSAEKTWSTKKGNCCCQTEVLLNLLNAKGVTNLKYCHSHNSKGGHVFAKVNGKYLDPTTRNGYGNYIKTYGSPIKITDFPNKPF
jgi:hypothetical protein